MKNFIPLHLMSYSVMFILIAALALMLGNCGSMVPNAAETKTISLTNTQMNAIDFGENVPSTVLTTTVADLRNTIESISKPGNYVVNVSDSGAIDEYILLPKNCVISLRGTGNNTISGNGSFVNPFFGSDALILRNITLSQSGANPIVLLFHGKLVMEEGSYLSSGETPAVYVMNGGNFVMNGGEIHYSSSETHGVYLSGSSASFEKKNGALIDNAENGAQNEYAIAVSNYSSIIACRDSAIESGETLSIRTNIDGTGIESKTGTWKKL